MTTLASFPPEILSDIFFNLAESDLAATCRVSKYLLEVARPLLYRNISFEFDSWDRKLGFVLGFQQLREHADDPNRCEEELAEERLDFQERYRTQTTLFHNLESNPEWCRWTQEIEIVYFASTTEDAHRCAALVSSMENLRIVIGRREIGHPNLVSLWEALPSSLVALDLSSSDLSPTDYVFICSKFPSLQKLSIGYSPGRFVTGLVPSPHLPLLHILKLAWVTNQTFLAALTSSSHSIAVLEIDFASARTVDISRFSNLKTLSFSGRWHDHYLDGVLAILEAACNLELLSVNLALELGWSSYGDGPDKILQRLPGGIERLALLEIPLTTDQLVSVVVRLAPTLKSLKVSLRSLDEEGNTRVHGVDYDEDRLTDVEEVCEEHGVNLEWVSGRSGRTTKA